MGIPWELLELRAGRAECAGLGQPSAAHSGERDPTLNSPAFGKDHFTPGSCSSVFALSGL